MIERSVDDMPYVCPGCHAFGGERCAPGCVDDEMDREREEASLYGDYERYDEDEPECLACDDTGYEPGMAGYYCTFCKRGHVVAARQMKAGIDPWNVDGQFDREESDENRRHCADWPQGEANG